MEKFSDNSDNEDFLNLASKEWSRITNAARKTGFREGVEDGANSVFQEGFNKGYEDGFRTAFILGKFKSLLNAIPSDVKHPRNINEILNKTRRGACHICMIEHENINHGEKPFNEIVNEQKIHSRNVLETLYEYFQPYIKQLNIDKLDKEMAEYHEDN